MNGGKPRTPGSYPVPMLLMPLSKLITGSESESGKPTPNQALELLKRGNKRFCCGRSKSPNRDRKRIILSAEENQAHHAFATVLSCSDSRVPVELIFDAGIMDIFVIRVAGNICGQSEIGSIEYGLNYVHTPVLVVLGHTQCGAITAATKAIDGHSRKLARNIPHLIDYIRPSVVEAAETHKCTKSEELIPYATENNVWNTIRRLFEQSPDTRHLVTKGKVKVVGAIYDLKTGKVNWLPQRKATAILKSVEEQKS